MALKKALDKMRVLAISGV